ncbi:MAG TPA: thiamine pyrophosphate-binding protein [Myxococcota bacterium]|nr:thiamine pyrophosphate-binding protein [Myxococcota bacterium]
MKLMDALATTLSGWGIKYIFGVSGANIEHLHDAIHRLPDQSIKSILAKSEIGAAFMADGHARRHHTLGVCCATSGGGMMNLAVGIAESYNDSVPILALVGQPPMELEGRGAFQDSSGKPRSVNAFAMFSTMSKFVARLDDPLTFWQNLAEAVSLALSDRPGPTVLLIPRNAYEWEVFSPPKDFPAELHALRRTQAPSAKEVDALWQLICNARDPVLILGSGVSRSSMQNYVFEFAKTSGIPVASTMADPGIYQNDMDNYFGMVGVAGHPSTHDQINHQGDLIVLVGCGLNIMIRAQISMACKNSRWAVVNVDPEPILDIIDPCAVVRGDAGEVFHELLNRLISSTWHRKPITPRTIARYTPELGQVQHTKEKSLRPSEAVFIMQDYLRTTTHIIFDAGNCASAALHYLKIPPGVSTNIALGFGGMGYAIAAAIGAQLGCKKGQTTVICGDGAFLMMGVEVHTAVQYGLPILFIVFNNASHGMCLTRQSVFFEGRFEAASYTPFDAQGFARSLGNEATLWTGRAQTADELRRCLYEYHRANLPGVLDLVVTADELPPFAPLLPKTAKTYNG